MPVVTLTFTPSDTGIISGIPSTVTITANSPATIYYTLDGTLPTIFSSVYTEPVGLPTNENSIILSAVAYYLDDGDNLVPSAILTETYSTDQSDLDRTRYLHFEGVVYSYPGGLDIPFYYDENGEVVYSLDVEESELTLVESDYDVTGEYRGTDNEVDPVAPDETATLVDNDISAFESPNNSTFKPEAKFIQIDGRVGAPDQVVQLINGPYMSLRDLKTSYGGIEHYNVRGTLYVSGDAARPHYDRQKGVMVFYYFDTNTSRWVKSIQDFPENTNPEITPIPLAQNPLVFKWFNFGRHQAAV